MRCSLMALLTVVSVIGGCATATNPAPSTQPPPVVENPSARPHPRPEFGTVSLGEVATSDGGRGFVLPPNAPLQAGVRHAQAVQWRLYTSDERMDVPGSKALVTIQANETGPGTWQATWSDPPSEPGRLFLFAAIHPDAPDYHFMVTEGETRWAVRHVGLVKVRPPDLSCLPAATQLQITAPGQWDVHAGVPGCRFYWTNTADNLRILAGRHPGMKPRDGWKVTEHNRHAHQFRDVTIPGSLHLYPGLIYLAPPTDKTGAPFWGPVNWQLAIAGEDGLILVTCTAANAARDLKEGQAAQRHVDASCPGVLASIRVGDLGQPFSPKLTRIEREVAIAI